MDSAWRSRRYRRYQYRHGCRDECDIDVDEVRAASRGRADIGAITPQAILTSIGSRGESRSRDMTAINTTCEIDIDDLREASRHRAIAAQSTPHARSTSMTFARRVEVARYRRNHTA